MPKSHGVGFLFQALSGAGTQFPFTTSRAVLGKWCSPRGRIIRRLIPSRVKLVAACALAVLLLASFAAAQSASAKGSISGTVTDQQSNPVAGAQVTIRNTDFSSKRELVTTESGGFSAAMLTPGAYTIEVKAPGFSLKKPARINVGVGSSVQITLRLGVARCLRECDRHRTWPDRRGEHAASGGEQRGP